MKSIKPRSIHRLATEILFSIAVFVTLPFAQSQTLQTLHSFSSHNTNSLGTFPHAGLVPGVDGNFYGTTSLGGVNGNGDGTVFKITSTGTLTTMVLFDNFRKGLVPQAGLVRGSDENFYGTTQGGGTNGGFGTVFRMTPNGTLTSLVSFNKTNGAQPYAGLVEGTDGNFYGTTATGGTNNKGSVFRMTPNGALTSLVSFNSTNGNSPMAGLIQASDGNFYGTTRSGGTNIVYGTAFRMTPAGVLTTLVSFADTNGSYPDGGLIAGSDGNFYGTTETGGSNYNGTIFKMTTNGALTTLVSFDGSNGSSPQAGLVQGSDGHFYGTTAYGGENNAGTVFGMTFDGALTTLVTFNGSNGQWPEAGLVQGGDGNFYGTTLYGGANDYGTVFRIVMPSLNAMQSGNKIVMSWPTNLVGFTLQSALNLNLSPSWADSTNSLVIIGGQYTVTNTISSNSQFYRLKK